MFCIFYRHFVIPGYQLFELQLYIHVLVYPIINRGAEAGAVADRRREFESVDEDVYSPAVRCFVHLFCYVVFVKVLIYIFVTVVHDNIECHLVRVGCFRIVSEGVEASFYGSIVALPCFERE